MINDFVDVVFDGPPSHESGRFVECENPLGYSVKIGEWIDRGNGMWALRIPLGLYDPRVPCAVCGSKEPCLGVGVGHFRASWKGEARTEEIVMSPAEIERLKELYPNELGVPPE